LPANLKIGSITHFYPKIGVAVVKLSSGLDIGDTVLFSGSNEFSQTVTSMQIEHEAITKAKKGQIIGLKVDQKVAPGDEVLRGY